MYQQNSNIMNEIIWEVKENGEIYILQQFNFISEMHSINQKLKWKLHVKRMSGSMSLVEYSWARLGWWLYRASGTPGRAQITRMINLFEH